MHEQSKLNRLRVIVQVINSLWAGLWEQLGSGALPEWEKTSAGRTRGSAQRGAISKVTSYRPANVVFHRLLPSNTVTHNYTGQQTQNFFSLGEELQPFPINYHRRLRNWSPLSIKSDLLKNLMEYILKFFQGAKIPKRKNILFALSEI